MLNLKITIVPKYEARVAKCEVVEITGRSAGSGGLVNLVNQVTSDRSTGCLCVMHDVIIATLLDNEKVHLIAMVDG